MPGSGALLLASLLLAAALPATLELGSPVKEKRGWTLNSAGYLLGPNALDNHRSLQDKYGLAGRRELQPEDEVRSGSADSSLPEGDVVRTVLEFLTFLRLKEAGALVHAHPSSDPAEDTEKPVLTEPGTFALSREVRL